MFVITNQYGNVDLTRTKLNGRYAHVSGQRLETLCRKLRIKFAKAVTRFDGCSRYGYRPVFDGVVVSSRSAPRLLQEIENRAERAARRKHKALQNTSVLSALFTLNRRAKRCRDMAQSYYQSRMHGLAGQMKREKEEIYRLKGQTLHYLSEDGMIEHQVFHQFDEGRWAEVLAGDGYRFHRPCPAPTDTVESESVVLEQIEAQPKGAREPTLEVAHEVISRYLGDRPEVPVFEWPPQIRTWRPRDWDYEDWDEDFDDEWDE